MRLFGGQKGLKCRKGVAFRGSYGVPKSEVPMKLVGRKCRNGVESWGVVTLFAQYFDIVARVYITSCVYIDEC